MGLYERLLEERAAEERHCGEILPPMRGLASKVLVRRLENALRRARLSQYWLVPAKKVRMVISDRG
jgi:hypothetical protein